METVSGILVKLSHVHSLRNLADMYFVQIKFSANAQHHQRELGKFPSDKFQRV